MKIWLEELAAELRGGLSMPVTVAFPDAPLPENPPVLTVALARVHLRPAGLGDGLAQLAEAVFLLSLYAETADRCAKEAVALPGLLPGLSLHGQGAVFDPETRWFVARFELTRRAVWPREAPPEEELVVIDWKGELLYELEP